MAAAWPALHLLSRQERQRNKGGLSSSKALTFCLERVLLPRTFHPHFIGQTWVTWPPLTEKMSILERYIFTPSQTRSFLERKGRWVLERQRPVPAAQSAPLLSSTHAHPPVTHTKRHVSRGRQPVCHRAPPRPGGSIRPPVALRPLRHQTSAPRDSASATG